MIGYLKGKIQSVNPAGHSLLVLCGSVGYTVRATNDLIAKTKVGSDAELFIHTAVREDDISLYGFARREELTFFEQLISVSGVGPKMALEILGTPLSITQTAIMNEDAGLMTKIKGVGRKTAERIIIELKGKIVPEELRVETQWVGKVNEEVIGALEALGYETMHIMKALAGMPKEIIETEAIIKYFLRQQA